MSNTDLYLCPSCTDVWTDGKLGDRCATCGVFCYVALRVHTVASFDAEGNGIDHRYEDMRICDVTEERAIEIAETAYPKHRILTGIEFLTSGPEELAAACEAYELASETFEVAMFHGRVQDALAHAWISWRAKARCPSCGRSQTSARFMPSDCSHGSCLAPIDGFALLPSCSVRE